MISRPTQLKHPLQAIESIARDCDAAEVRLPPFDQRRPLGPGGSDLEIREVLTESDNRSTLTHHSSSLTPTSSHCVSHALPSISDQPDSTDDLSLASINIEANGEQLSTSNDLKETYNLTSKPEDDLIKDRTSLHKLTNGLRTSPKNRLASNLQSRAREDHCIQDTSAVRRRPKQEAAKQQKQQKGQAHQRTPRVCHLKGCTNPTTPPFTLRQIKPVTDTPPSGVGKPAIRLPQRLPTMSDPLQPNEHPNSTNGTSSSHRRGDYASLRGLHRGANNVPYHPYPASGYNDHSQAEWSTWQELGIKISNLPASTTTRDLWRCFSGQGNIIKIELYENQRGQRDGKASVRFSPPPKNPFWKNARYSIPITTEGIVTVGLEREPRGRTFMHTSPIDTRKKYEEVMVLNASSLDFGMMPQPATMMNMCTVLPSPEGDIQFCLSLLHREITVEFLLDIRDQRTNRNNQKVFRESKDERQDKFRFQIPLSQLGTIYRVDTSNDDVVLLLSLETPPKFFKKLEAAQTHDDDARYWSDHDTWYRQTDVVYSQSSLKKSPLTLKKTRPIIDIGRWTTYRLVFKKSNKSMSSYHMICQALQDYNIEILPFGRLEILEQFERPVWEFLDKPTALRQGIRADLIELGGPQALQLAFPVRYQLEVCISNGYFNEYNLSQAFISHLQNMDVGKAQDLLVYVANHAKRVYDPMSLFNLNIAEGAPSRANIPHYCVYIHSVTVTPTTVYFQTPIPETSNRVIRDFAQYADRFLRVRFTEEKTQGKIYATDKDTMNEVFTRVKRVLTNGIVIGDRSYEFLACGNSQFREHGAYFFAPLPHLPTEKIRKRMGLFSDIKTVPLYLARLGQCFSTTRAIQSTKTELKELDDIERNGYTFSDGVGKISPLVAHLAASELGILQHLEEPPSVFQIRAGGCKGVVAVWPTPSPTDVLIRKSQYKFPANREGLEIIRWSQYACANLNRQLILILSALGVPDEVFIRKLQLQLSNLKQAMTDERTALAILQKDVDHNQMTLTVASMVLDGFQRTSEPFMTSLLHLWRAWSIKYLKEKARITIGGGALLFGCVDEAAVLSGHFNDTPSPPIDAPTSEKAKLVPEVFVQLSKNARGKPEVITGPMLLARNPSLHPGDVRVVRGVDVPELRHLKDVVVLPQTGDRDVASMCSGGDLDGDDFLVIWDVDLLPREWNVEPMDYSRPPMVKHGRNIGIDDLTTFFVTYMKNDTLSQIARAHLANADFLEEGVKDEKCLKLANLHSMAVDYVKTGHPAQMPRNLRPQKRPHFMDNNHKRKENTYISRKILGQLYDQVECVDFVPSFMARFDDRILRAYEVDSGLLTCARAIKKDYDGHVRRIMAQHEIKTEFEVWSTFVLEHTRSTNDFKFHEQIGQISAALKSQFRNVCYQQAGGKTFEEIGPFTAAMYKVTADEMAQAVQECQQMRSVGGRQMPLRRMTSADMPLMSFPWLFQDVLGKIAKNSERKANRNDPEDTANTAARDALRSTQALRARGHPTTLDRVKSDLEAATGTIPPGELLQLFKNFQLHDQ